MATWEEVIQEIQTAPNQFDTVRTDYLSQLARYRERNVIAYYSSFLHKIPLLRRLYMASQAQDKDKARYRHIGPTVF